MKNLSDTSVLVQQCYRPTSKQEGKDEFEGATTFREGETRFKIHEYNKYLPTVQQRVTDLSVFSIISHKMKVKLAA